MKRGKRYRNKNPLPIKINKNDNAPPKNPDYQDVPSSIKEFMKLKQLALQRPTKPSQSKTKKEKPQQNTKNAEKRASHTKFTSTPHSSQKSTITKSKTPSSFAKRKNKKREKLREKRKLKEQQKRKLHEEDVEADLNDYVKDEVKFGEVVHRPPQISTLPRKVNKTGYENRPGRKDDLLLKSLLKQKNIDSDSLKRKKKQLSVSDQRQIEIERQKARLAYKNMKIKSYKNKS